MHHTEKLFKDGQFSLQVILKHFLLLIPGGT